MVRTKRFNVFCMQIYMKYHRRRHAMGIFQVQVQTTCIHEDGQQTRPSNNIMAYRLVCNAMCSVWRIVYNGNQITN